MIVLKGHHTIVAAPGQEPLVNVTGNPGMATGGSGDVLAGMIASFAAQGMSPDRAAMRGLSARTRRGRRCGAVVAARHAAYRFDPGAGRTVFKSGIIGADFHAPPIFSFALSADGLQPVVVCGLFLASRGAGAPAVTGFSCDADVLSGYARQGEADPDGGGVSTPGADRAGNPGWTDHEVERRSHLPLSCTECPSGVDRRRFRRAPLDRALSTRWMRQGNRRRPLPRRRMVLRWYPVPL